MNDLGLDEKAKDLVFGNATIIKARVYGPEGAAPPNVTSLPEEGQGAFTAAGAIVPPYDPGTLCLIAENSQPLRPNVDAYSTNIESFGYRLEPVVNLTSVEADQQIEDQILLERMYDNPHAAEIEVTPEEVQERRVLIQREARIERLQVEIFFKHCVTDGGSFIELREKTRQDLEITGNGYWEVIRNGLGQITQLGYVPSLTCRLLRADKNYIRVPTKQKISALSYREVDVQRKFRRFVQVLYGVEKCFFKEFGDPRVVSAGTGKPYETYEAFRYAEGPSALEATELIHFRIFSPRSAYGIPRWIGALLAVLGSRASEEVNYLYFDNKGVPPLAITVSGGVLAKDAVDRVQKYVDTQIKGRENFHSILLLEAEATGTGTSGKVKIELKPLTDAQQKDALFQEYFSNAIESVGCAFRNPRILRGQMTDFNKATAEAALQYAEMQVFQPERARFDHLINTRLFAAMEVKHWTFTSNSPIARDPAVLTEMLSKLLSADVLTINEARELANDIFNKQYAMLPHFWARQPMKLTIAGLTSGKPDFTQPDPPPPDPNAAPVDAGAEDTAALGAAPEMPALPEASDEASDEAVGPAVTPEGAALPESPEVEPTEAAADPIIGELEEASARVDQALATLRSVLVTNPDPEVHQQLDLLFSDLRQSILEGMATRQAPPALPELGYLTAVAKVEEPGENGVLRIYLPPEIMASLVEPEVE